MILTDTGPLVALLDANDPPAFRQADVRLGRGEGGLVLTQLVIHVYS